MPFNLLETVIPAQAGIQTKDVPPVLWIPACAGMTIRVVSEQLYFMPLAVYHST